METLFRIAEFLGVETWELLNAIKDLKEVKRKKRISNKSVKVTAITNKDETIKNEFAKSLPQATCSFPYKTFSEYMKFCVNNNCLFN